MIEDYLVDLPSLASEANHEGSKGVLPNCQMKCDAMPCKNLGICTEDFNRQESSCNCELTSYFGEHCADGEPLPSLSLSLLDFKDACFKLRAVR